MWLTNGPLEDASQRRAGAQDGLLAKCGHPCGKIAQSLKESISI